jgi:uncharacterized Zn-binding protein involved in type VI secretion
MSRGVARQNDRTIGTCFAHDPPITVGGTIVTASGTVSANGLQLARKDDMVIADCGHVSRIITSADQVSSTLEAALLAARQSDSVGGGPYRATIVSSSGTVSTS